MDQNQTQSVRIGLPDGILSCNGYRRGHKRRLLQSGLQLLLRFCRRQDVATRLWKMKAGPPFQCQHPASNYFLTKEQNYDSSHKLAFGPLLGREIKGIPQEFLHSKRGSLDFSQRCQMASPAWNSCHVLKWKLLPFVESFFCSGWRGNLTHVAGWLSVGLGI